MPDKPQQHQLTHFFSCPCLRLQASADASQRLDGLNSYTTAELKALVELQTQLQVLSPLEHARAMLLALPYYPDVGRAKGAGLHAWHWQQVGIMAICVCLTTAVFPLSPCS